MVDRTKRHKGPAGPGWAYLAGAASALLLAASLAGAQPHAGFQLENLDLSGSGLDLKADMGVGGFGFLSDGRLAVATWGGDKRKSAKNGKLYLLSGVLTEGPIQAERLAVDLEEPLGMAVVADKMYLSDKWGILRFLPNGDSSRHAPLHWSGNYHEYHFSMVHKDGYLYSNASQPFPPEPSAERGSFIRTSLADGSREFLAAGFREPNGLCVGPEGDFFASDNEGHWVPTSKIMHVDSGDYFGFRNPEGPFVKETSQQKPPVVWFLHDKIASSPLQPTMVPKGIFQGQLLVGDHKTCKLMRIFVEKVQGTWQGAVFVVLDGDQMASTANRMLWGPDGNLYMGGMGSVTAWGAACKGHREIQKVTLTEEREFEILAMRSLENGFELEFTETPGPSAMETGSYSLERWGYDPGGGYGEGRNVDSRGVTIQGVEQGTRPNSVRLVVSPGDLQHGDGLLPSTTFELDAGGVKSASGKPLRKPEAWYTLNKIGPGQDPVSLERRRENRLSPDHLSLSADSRSLFVRGAGEVRARIQTLDGRVLEEIKATAPTVLRLGPLPTGVHLLTGTLDRVPFAKKVVAAN